MKEKTLKKSIKITGTGIHTGKKTVILLHPSKGGGIRFMKEGIEIPATLDSVSETDRGVDLSHKEVKIITVEHLLAALFACEIDHLDIEVKGEEIPALDGSAYPFIKEIKKAGTVNLKSEKNFKYIEKSSRVESEGCFASVIPSANLEIRYIISYDHPLLSYQEYLFNGKSDIIDEISDARTYGLLSWKDYLQSRGYALGASEHNTLIYSNEDTINKPRYPDEAVRHKILDLTGDISLLNPIPIGSYFVFRGGHKLHFELLNKIKRSEY